MRPQRLHTCPSPPDSSAVGGRTVGRELRSLSHLLMRYLEGHAHKKTIDSITGTNGWIIGYLAARSDTDVFQRDLERDFCITRSTASKVLILMEKKGLVKRTAVPHDARLKKLTLTERAKELAEWMREDARLAEAALTRGFSPEELHTLQGYLQRMKQNLQE
ncbi:MAG: MarR family transcriptional regulator [Eubacteriales bacterium]